MPKLTMHKIKLLYRLGRIRTKHKKVFVAKAGFMDDSEFEGVWVLLINVNK